MIWIDASSGLAGDMLVGALIDAGGSLDAVRGAAEALSVRADLSVERVRRGAFAASKFEVSFSASDHDHVHWSSIRERISEAGLPERATRRSLAVFGLLAKAEARVHGVEVDEVCFHEVGAVDSLVDIVGACVLLDEVDDIVCSALPAGGGFVDTQHGRISVPAPATVGVLAGWPMVQDGRVGELVTPTGAAIVAALASCGPMPSMSVQAQGWGAGTRDPSDWSNTVRVVRGERIAAGSDSVVELSANLDDLPGEQVPPLIAALLSAGALDAWATPVVMKKGRPGLVVSALSRPSSVGAVEDAMLRHSSTFGVRRHRADRRILERRHITVETDFGPIRVKLGAMGEEILHAAPEYEDCRAAASKAGVPVARVHAAALKGVPWP